MGDSWEKWQCSIVVSESFRGVRRLLATCTSTSTQIPPSVQVPKSWFGASNYVCTCSLPLRLNEANLD